MEVISRAKAKSLGLQNYFTGTACKQGHVCERYVSDYHCVECHKIKNTSEERKAFKKIFYADNKDRLIEDQKNYNQINIEEIKVYKKHYCKNNPEKSRFYGKNRRVAINNSAIHYDFYKPEIGHIKWTAKRMTELLGVQFHVDHVIPLKHPLVCGLHIPFNLQVIKASENQVKHNRFNMY